MSGFYTYPAQADFLESLARHMQEVQRETQCDLADMWVLLPNRRSCKAFEAALLSVCETDATLLPHIMPLGDLDPAQLLQQAILNNHPLQAEFLALPNAMPDMQRHMLLMQPWLHYASTQTHRDMHQSWQANHAMLQEMLQMFDLCEEHHVSADQWEASIPASLSRHAKEQAEWLSIIARYWPTIQEESGCVSSVERRNQLLKLAADLWKSAPPSAPVFAAGSTGTVPATAALLHNIAQMEQGYVVLPAYDVALDEEVTAHHPQANMRRLVGDSQVSLWGEESAATPAIRAVFSDDLPQNNKYVLPESLTLLNVKNTAEEQVAALLLAKDMLAQTPSAQIAIISPDKTQLRQMAALFEAEKLPYHLTVEQRLVEVSEGELALCITRYVCAQEDPAMLLDLLRHPLVMLGESREKHVEYIHKLEEDFLRGLPIVGGLEGWLQELRYQSYDGDSIAWLESVQQALSPLLAYYIGAPNPAVELSKLVEAHRAAYDALTADLQENGAQKTLQDWFDTLTTQAVMAGEIDPYFYPHFVQDTLQHSMLSSSIDIHAAIQLLTPIEARLLQMDRTIILHMNEGTWPPASSSSMWLHDGLREEMTLPTTAQQAGLTAHDMWMLLHRPEVYALRTSKEGGAPSVASRYWNRLEAYATPAQTTHYWNDWIAQWHENNQAAHLSPPQPNPPVDAIPKRISITQYDSLQRDPYGFYAAHILKLSPLDKLAQLPDMALYGKLIHRVMEEVTKAIYADKQTLTEAVFHQAIERCFAVYSTMPVVASVWRWRLEALVPWLYEQEQARYTDSTTRPEVKVQWECANGREVIGRIDRLETSRKTGEAIVADYKTGAIASKQDALNGYASQLPLSALALQAQGEKVGAAHYWKIASREEMSTLRDLQQIMGEAQSWEELLERTQDWLNAWHALLDSGEMVFRAVPRLAYASNYNAYAHLERLEEWNYCRDNAGAEVA